MKDRFGFMIVERDGRLLGDRFYSHKKEAWRWTFENNADLILEAQERGALAVRVRISFPEDTPSA